MPIPAGTYQDGASGWPGGGTTGSAIRLSDADRAEVTDQLTQHFSDGRLDQAEFDERMGRAMSAKTRADLKGLFDDLPPLRKDPAPAQRVAVRPRPRPRRHPWLAVLLIVVAAIAVGHALTHLFFFPWLWIALAVFLLVRCGPGRRRRRW